MDAVQARISSMRGNGYSQAAIEQWLDEEGLIESGQPLPSMTGSTAQDHADGSTT